MYQNVKTQLVEIPIAAGSTLSQFKFPNQDFLRQKQIISIETYAVENIAFAPSGNGVVTTANMQAAYLTLYGQNPESVDDQGIPSSGDGQWIESLPLVAMHRTQIYNGATPSVFDLFCLKPRVIVWEKSFVALANGQVLGNVAAISFIFNVGYIGNAGDKN